MSRVRADIYTNSTADGPPSFPNGASVTGIITANSFNGNITGTAATFTGNVSIAGTLTYEDVTNVDSIGLVTARTGVRVTSGGIVVTAGITTLTTLIPEESRFNSVSEKSTLVNGNTISLTYNSGGGNIAICTNPTGPITLNVTGIPETSDFDNQTLTFSVVAIQTGTGYACTSVTLNGYSSTIRYSGGTVSTGNTSSLDVFNFIGINTVGSASTTANYMLISNVNGDYRFY